jgi:hypothetical protein
MFVTKKRHEREIANLRREIESLAERCWRMRDSHDRLMAHLGLMEREKSGFEIVETKSKANER